MTQQISNRKSRGYLNYRPIPHEITEVEREAIRNLVSIGTRIACMSLTRWPSQPYREFRADVLERARRSMSVLDGRNPTDAITAVTGESFDVIDIDPRNGGSATWHATQVYAPTPFAVADTPGEGQHLYVAPTGCATLRVGGIDYLAHRSWVYLPGTLRPKYNGAGYSWSQSPDLTRIGDPAPSYRAALDAFRRTDATYDVQLRQVRGGGLWNFDSSQSLLGRWGLFTHLSRLVAQATPGERNNFLHWAARKAATVFGSDPELRSIAERYLIHACHENNLVTDDGEATCRATIQSGFDSAHHKKGNTND